MLLFTVAFAAISSCVTVAMLDSAIEEIEESQTVGDYKRAMENAEGRELFLSLTLSDSSLSEIGTGMRELVLLAEMGRSDEIETAKGRLICLIEHQRRLSGFNARSIF